MVQVHLGPPSSQPPEPWSAGPAALATGRAGTGTSPEEQAAAQIQAFARAAASGRYPSLAAALAAAGPVRGKDAILRMRPWWTPALLRSPGQPCVPAGGPACLLRPTMK